MTTRNVTVATLAMLLLVCLALPALAAKDDTRAEEKRAKIDEMAEETLVELLEKNPEARKLFDAAHGYAVFDNVKLSLFISGGGGIGVAVDRTTDERTYMKMGTAGVNIGLGGQKYQVVFLFQTPERFEAFVDRGWEADAQANAVAGDRGKNVAGGFRNGMAIYQITDKGLMLQADVAGTKYWQSKKLNR